MKAKVIASVVFLAVFLVGVFFMDKFIPYDEVGLIRPYVEEVNVFLPPLVNIVQNFKAEDMAIVTVSMDKYKKITGTDSKNFVVTSLIST
jgi:hypothetical protein